MPKRMRGVFGSVPYGRAGRRVRRRAVRRIAGKAAFRAGTLARIGVRASPYAYGGYLAYRGTKALFSRRNIGERIGTGTSKRAVTSDQNITNQNTRTLYQHGMCDIAEGTAIDSRERRIANIRGFKICCEFKNKGDQPLYLNCAVLSVKGGSSSAGVQTQDFFRASEGPDRARDFDTTLNGNEFHCLPINTDRYTILKHKRYRLVAAAAGGDTVALSGYSYMNLDWYVPLKRQVRWDSSGASNPESGAVFFIYWADDFGANTGQAAVVSRYQSTVRTITYFKEPKN